jgi:hypothetical protein
MISTIFYKGMGTGNQLANYVTVRCLALDKGFKFGVMYPENFKGASFLKLDMGLPVIGGEIPVEGQPPITLPEGLKWYYREQFIDNGDYDPELKNVKDNTLIHGLLQGVKYFEHRRDMVQEWLKVPPPLMLDRNTCVINIRGGEYRYVPSFILPKSYWENGIKHMKSINPNMKFEVHTDDYEYARSLFPDYVIVSDIGLNWRSLNYARYLLLSNSSFAILPVYLSNEARVVIAPKYFGRHNVSKGEWLLSQNIVDGFIYMDRDGKLFDSKTCKKELEEYNKSILA